MIAISYRREDSLPIAGRLYDRLQARFGKENVFMDFDSIPPGVDFREQIKHSIERSNLVLAVIGPHWLGEDSDGSRRIDDPTDFVRLEIQDALERGIPVIPLLINNTPMPKPESLPSDIESLAFRNALALDSGIDFHRHVDRLLSGIMNVGSAKTAALQGKQYQATPIIGRDIPERLKRERDRIVAALSAKKVSLALLVLFCIVAAASFLPRSQQSYKKIAVLPFGNLSDDKDNAYFTDGIQNDILTNLSKIRAFKVISRTSVMRYGAETPRDVREIGKTLGVAYVLEGNVQRARERVKVNAQLIDARTDTHVWAKSYERALSDIFAIQSEIAQSIATELNAVLSPAEKAAINRAPTNDLAAYERYLKAKTLIFNSIVAGLTYDSLTEAVLLLDEAIKRDPSFSLAYYQLAHAHDQFYHLSFDHSPERIALAEKAIQSLQDLSPDSGEAHLAQAKHLNWVYRDYDRAREELRAAQRNLANDSELYLHFGYVDRRQGRWNDSIRHMQRALELDPQNVLVPEQIALTYQNLRRYADMAAILDRAVAIAPDDVSTRLKRATVELEWRADPGPMRSVIESILAKQPESLSSIATDWFDLALCQRDVVAVERAIAVMPGDECAPDEVPFGFGWCKGLVARLKGDTQSAHAAFTSARTEVEKLVQDQPTYAKAFCALGMIDAALGRKNEAINEGRRAVELLPVVKDSVDGALLIQYLAIIYAWSDDTDAALKELAAAVKMPGYLSYGQLRLHPYWDPLRGDPRFDAIVESLAPK